MPKSLDPRIRHHDVQFAEMADRLLKERGYFGGLGHVGGDGDGAGAEGFNVADDGGGGIGAVGVVDYQGGTAGGELEGVLAAQAAAGAGDEGDFAVEAGGGGSSRG